MNNNYNQPSQGMGSYNPPLPQSLANTQGQVPVMGQYNPNSYNSFSNIPNPPHSMGPPNQQPNYSFGQSSIGVNGISPFSYNLN